MRSDIAASIRQGRWAYQAHEPMLMDQDVAQQNDDNDDEDEANETNEVVNDFQLCVPASGIVDDSSSDEEE